MKRFIYLLALSLLFSLSSCIREDITIDSKPSYPSSNSGIQIIGASEEFDVHNVGTRAEDGVSDSYISEMTMLIFNNNGDMLTAFNADGKMLESSHINIRRSNPTFLIETSKSKGKGILASMESGLTTKYYDNTAENISACKIYIVANADHLIGERLEAGEIKSIDELKEALLDTNIKLDMPFNTDTGEYIGLPMIGCARDQKTDLEATFDLSYHEGEGNNNAVATIPLKKLYSKINFTIQVNSKQLVTGQTPEFMLDDVEVFNVPSTVRMEYDDKAGDYDRDYLYTEASNKPHSFKDNGMLPSDLICRHSSSADTDDVIEFHFYMPEHRVTPEKNEDEFKYPDNLPKDNRQYFKPELINGKTATFVRIHGIYTDHNGQIHDVAYDIYLGQDNTDDFEVVRNQLLNNKLIINGITNHKDAYGGDENTISFDHRVTISHKGYHFSIEREAILDSHFEVRPLDVELEAGATMSIVIPEESKSWIGMESDAVAKATGGNAYITGKGVRKYFTTNLISELHTSSDKSIINEKEVSSITIENTSEKKVIYRIWFYIDENLNVYDGTMEKDTSKEENGYTVSDKIYRVGKVNFYYAKKGSFPDFNAEPTETINFQQWNLWRVWSSDGNRSYDIEHEEEYLNNYASDIEYGNTHEEGIPWGLPNVPLSNEYESFTINETNSDWTDWVDEHTSLLTYDFYIKKHDQAIATASGAKKIREFAGQAFTSEIFTKSNGGVKVLELDDQPSGAVEYCYNRNKRNSNGSIAKVEWYLPSADELEDFIVPAYSYFKEFQDNYYWTSQPAYIRNIFYYEYRNWALFGSGSVQDAYSFVVYEDNKDYARATKVVSLGNDQFDYAKSGLNDIPNDPKDRETIPSNEPNAIELGYFNEWHAWYRDKNGNVDLVTKSTNQVYNETIDRSSTDKRYYAYLNHLYDMTQEGYHLRTKSNRVRCVRKVATQQ